MAKENGMSMDSGESPDQNESAPTTRLVVGDEEEMTRLDSFLVKNIEGFSRAKLQRAIGKGKILVDGKSQKSSTRLKPGQTVEVEHLESGPVTSLPEDIPLVIIYEDDSLVAINKPPAMVVHPAKGHWSGTLTAALAFHFENLSSVGGPTRPGIVHRLDRDTSGIILVAKTDEAHANLAQQFEQRTVQKEYWAIVTPAPDRDRDMIDQPIGAHPYQREKKAIRENHSTSREAQTFFEVVERMKGFAIVRTKPRTGRTHQIRVHLAHIGCPVLCDKLYSGRSRLTKGDLKRGQADEQLILERQALHAHRIQFRHPESGELVELEATLPEDLKYAVDQIRELRPLK